MAWYEIIGIIVGGGGVITAMITLYNARPQKDALVIENMKQVIKELREQYDEYKRDNEERFDKLEAKVLKMEERNNIKQNAINKGYRCSYVPQDKKCPVTESFEHVCQCADCIDNK